MKTYPTIARTWGSPCFRRPARTGKCSWRKSYSAWGSNSGSSWSSSRASRPPRTLRSPLRAWRNPSSWISFWDTHWGNFPGPSKAPYQSPRRPNRPFAKSSCPWTSSCSGAAWQPRNGLLLKSYLSCFCIYARRHRRWCALCLPWT